MDDIVDVIRMELSKPGIKNWIGPGTEVVVSKVEAYYPWKAHLEQHIRIKTGGGLRDDSTANHMYLVMLRRGVACYTTAPGFACTCLHFSNHCDRTLRHLRARSS